jgi:regulatory protein
VAKRGAAARSLKARAIQWLSQREHSRLELRRKLLRPALSEVLAQRSQDSPATGLDADIGAGFVAGTHKGAEGGSSAGFLPPAGRETSSGPQASAAQRTGRERQGAQVERASSEDTALAKERVDAVLDWLQQHQYLSEDRFIESRVHARAARFGNLRIRQEMAQHQLELSPQMAERLKDTELARAKQIWQRKYGEPPQSPAERMRQARFLAGRGFSPETVRQVFRDLGRGQKVDTESAAEMGAGDDDWAT